MNELLCVCFTSFNDRDEPVNLRCQNYVKRYDLAYHEDSTSFPRIEDLGHSRQMAVCWTFPRSCIFSLCACLLNKSYILNLQHS